MVKRAIQAGQGLYTWARRALLRGLLESHTTVPNRLSRRELLASLLGLGAGVSLAPLAACRRSPARNGHRPGKELFTRPAFLDKLDGALLGPDATHGHRLRDDLPALLRAHPARTDRVDVAVVGAGPAGISAAFELQRRGIERLLLVDLEREPGGTSRAGKSDVTAYPWGAHYLPVPMPENGPLRQLLREFDLIEGEDEWGAPVGAEHALVRDPEERLFIHGYWQAGLFPRVGATGDDLAQLARFEREVDRYVALRDGRGRRAFTIPIASASDDEALVSLERKSAMDWLLERGFTSKRLLWFLEYACRDDYGLRLQHTSAWALLFYFAARTVRPGGESQAKLAFPDGNGTLVRAMMRPLQDRFRGGRLAVDIAPIGSGDAARVRLLNVHDNSIEEVIAKRVICALPQFIRKRVIRDLDQDDSAFSYGPWLVANLHLKDRPREWGAAPAWDNVIYDSPSLGYVSATHQQSRYRGPTVWTYYYPLTDDDPSAGRSRLLAADWELWAEVILRDLLPAHDDLERLLHRLDVWRWGHGMTQPRLGQVFSQARRRAKQPLGPIHFAHSDLSGVALFEESFHHGTRAAAEVLQILRPDSLSGLVVSG